MSQLSDIFYWAANRPKPDFSERLKLTYVNRLAQMKTARWRQKHFTHQPSTLTVNKQRLHTVTCNLCAMLGKKVTYLSGHSKSLGWINADVASMHTVVRFKSDSGWVISSCYTPACPVCRRRKLEFNRLELPTRFPPARTAKDTFLHYMKTVGQDRMYGRTRLLNDAWPVHYSSEFICDICRMLTYAGPEVVSVTRLVDGNTTVACNHCLWTFLCRRIAQRKLWQDTHIPHGRKS